MLLLARDSGGLGFVSSPPDIKTNTSHSLLLYLSCITPESLKCHTTVWNFYGRTVALAHMALRRSATVDNRQEATLWSSSLPMPTFPETSDTSRYLHPVWISQFKTILSIISTADRNLKLGDVTYTTGFLASSKNFMEIWRAWAMSSLRGEYPQGPVHSLWPRPPRTQSKSIREGSLPTRNEQSSRSPSFQVVHKAPWSSEGKAFLVSLQRVNNTPLLSQTNKWKMKENKATYGSL